MILFERPIRFEEVDAAGIVFFGHYLRFAHEAMEHFFASLDGGYPHLIVKRRVGLPAVDVAMKFVSPARYGDTLAIATSTARLGTKSAVLRYVMKKLGTDTVISTIDHTIVTTDLDAMRSIVMPADVRQQLVAHLVPAPTE